MWDRLCFNVFLICSVYSACSILRSPFGDPVIVCFHTSSSFQHPLRNCTSPPPSSKFYVWLDGRDGWCCWCSSDRSASASSDQSSTFTADSGSIFIDDTLTEPATSPRMIAPQAEEWAVELQLPTKEILVHGRNLKGMLQGSSSMMVNGHQKNMKGSYTKHLKLGTTSNGIEKLVKQPKGNTKSSIAAWKNGKHRSKVEASKTIQLFHMVHLRRRLHPCELFQKFTMLSGGMILPRLQGRSRSLRKPLQQQVEGRPAAFYSGDEPPRIGTAPAQPPPPPKPMNSWDVQATKIFHPHDSLASTSSTYRGQDAWSSSMGPQWHPLVQSIEATDDDCHMVSRLEWRRKVPILDADTTGPVPGLCSQVSHLFWAGRECR